MRRRLPIDDLNRVIERFRALRVLVVGDVILDAYVRGAAERISPEAPVPVLGVTEQWSALGGAANVAHQIAALGASVDLISVVGEDEPGRSLLGQCEAEGLDPSSIVIEPGRTTTRKLRVLAGRQQLARLDWEDRRPLHGAVASRIVGLLRARPRPDAVVVSDYAKGVLTDEVLQGLAACVAEWGVPMLVDPKVRPLSGYPSADLVKVNRVELESVVGRPLVGDGVEDLRTCLDAVRRDAAIPCLVVTLGEAGLVISDDVRGVRHHPTTSRDVFDVSGAGDTVIGVLSLCLGAGVDIDRAASIANLAASVAVRKVGVAIVDRAELIVEGRAVASGGVVSRSELAVLARAWRTAGRRIVFTNGCFDLFHEGHLELLRAAALEGDVLVVGVDSDASVRSLKGADRPAVGELERSGVIAAVSGVDAVVLFETDELRELIEVLRPDVLVKGADYEHGDIVGHDLVEMWGGKVVLVPLVPGRSTSDRLRRLGEQNADGGGQAR